MADYRMGSSGDATSTNAPTTTGGTIERLLEAENARLRDALRTWTVSTYRPARGQDIRTECRLCGAWAPGENEDHLPDCLLAGPSPAEKEASSG